MGGLQAYRDAEGPGGQPAGAAAVRRWRGGRGGVYAPAVVEGAGGAFCRRAEVGGADAPAVVESAGGALCRLAEIGGPDAHPVFEVAGRARRRSEIGGADAHPVLEVAARARRLAHHFFAHRRPPSLFHQGVPGFAPSVAVVFGGGLGALLLVVAQRVPVRADGARRRFVSLRCWQPNSAQQHSESGDNGGEPPGSPPLVACGHDNYSRFHSPFDYFFFFCPCQARLGAKRPELSRSCDFQPFLYCRLPGKTRSATACRRASRKISDSAASCPRGPESAIAASCPRVPSVPDTAHQPGSPVGVLPPRSRRSACPLCALRCDHEARCWMWLI